MNKNLIALKEIAQEVGITERKARKILRENEAEKQHTYFWMFTEKESKQVAKKLKRELH
jgi:predicted transcriptional regulator